MATSHHTVVCGLMTDHEWPKHTKNYSVRCDEIVSIDSTWIHTTRAVATRILKRSIRWDPYRNPSSITHNSFSIRFWKYSTLFSFYFAIIWFSRMLCIALHFLVHCCVTVFALTIFNWMSFFHFHLKCSLVVYFILRSRAAAHIVAARLIVCFNSLSQCTS